MTDLSRAPRKPFAHQIRGVERLVQTVEPNVGRILPGCFLLGDEMRLGKSCQIIMAAQALFEQGLVNTIIVVAPASVRGVWFDPDLGELAKHHWPGLPIFVTEYHSRSREWTADYAAGQPFLRFVVTNYEYIRYGIKRLRTGWTGPHLEPLLRTGPKTMLVLDESSAVGNFSSLQSRACSALRQKCERVVLLNGTPGGENPEAIFSQAKLMDNRIFGMSHVSQFRARYAILGGYHVEVVRYGKMIKLPTEILGWRHAKHAGCCEIPEHIKSPVHGFGPGLEEIQARVAPYVLRRLKADCLDLPPKLDPVTLTAVLTPETWKVYKAMRDETVAWLDRQNVAISVQAGVAVMRLAQVTSGFIGGIKDMEAVCPVCQGLSSPEVGRSPLALPLEPHSAGEDAEGLNLEREECPACGGEGTLPLPVAPRAVSREKLDVFLGWVRQRLREDPEMRMLTWCRFRPELARTIDELCKVDGLTVKAIYGGQKKQEREEGLRLMHPEVRYTGPAVLVGTLGTGAMGLNMAGAHEVVYTSNGYSLMQRQQSEDRPHGPGQTQPVSYHDIIAVGPDGQKTIDHTIVKNLRTKRDMAEWTTSAWVEALVKE